MHKDRCHELSYDPSLKFVCWSSNPQHLKMWLYLDMRSLLGSLQQASFGFLDPLQQGWGGVGWFFPPTSNSLNTIWVSNSSTQCWHCLPGDSATSYRLRVQSSGTANSWCQTPVTSPCYYRCFRLTGYRRKFPWTPP